MKEKLLLLLKIFAWMLIVEDQRKKPKLHTVTVASSLDQKLRKENANPVTSAVKHDMKNSAVYMIEATIEVGSRNEESKRRQLSFQFPAWF